MLKIIALALIGGAVAYGIVTVIEHAIKAGEDRETQKIMSYDAHTEAVFVSAYVIPKMGRSQINDPYEITFQYEFNNQQLTYVQRFEEEESMDIAVDGGYDIYYIPPTSQFDEKTGTYEEGATPEKAVAVENNKVAE